MGTSRAAADAAQRLQLMKQAVEVTPSATEQMRAGARALELRLMDLQEALNGDRTRPSRAEPGMPGIISRVNSVVSGHWRAMHGPTQTHREQYEIAAAAFSDVYDDLRQLIETDLPALERQLEAVGAPWTPGRALPGWTRPNP
jgi:hypothetical protein